jgi:hypothetical protein
MDHQIIRHQRVFVPYYTKYFVHIRKAKLTINILAV